MKPIYLYVESYKVLQNQEISLSSHFSINKNGYSFEVFKTEIEPDFYAEGLDITSLFGKNGSGKSTSIELIMKMTSNSICNECDFMAIFEDNNTLYYSSNIKFASVFSNYYDCVRIDENTQFNYNKKNVIYFSHSIEPLSASIIHRSKNFTNLINCSNQAKISSLANKKFQREQVKECFELLSHYNMNKFGINNVPMIGASYPVSEIHQLISKINKVIFNLINDLMKNDNEALANIDDSSLLSIDNSLYRIDENSITMWHYYNKSGRDSNILFNLDSIFTSKKIKDISKSLIKHSDRYIDLLISMNDLLDYSTELSNSIGNSKNIDREHDKIASLGLLDIYLKTLLGEITALNLEREISKKNIFKHHYKNIATKNRSNIERYELHQLSSFIQKTLNDNDDGIFHISSYDEFQFIDELINHNLNIFSNLELKWNGISSGQYSLLVMLSRLYKQCLTGNDLIIFIDEGESNLHPEWQRTYINDLVSFFSRVKNKSQKIQLIITSHSPFVLSDLPSQSINFIGSKKTKNHLFGSNIFDIYNKGFLLERTIGQFSYEKIQSVIESIRSNTFTQQDERTIDMIGDEFIKELILQMKDKKK